MVSFDHCTMCTLLCVIPVLYICVFHRGIVLCLILLLCGMADLKIIAVYLCIPSKLGMAMCLIFFVANMSLWFKTNTFWAFFNEFLPILAPFWPIFDKHGLKMFLYLILAANTYLTRPHRCLNPHVYDMAAYDKFTDQPFKWVAQMGKSESGQIVF